MERKMGRALLEITSVVPRTQSKLVFPSFASLELKVPMLEWRFAFLKTKEWMREFFLLCVFIYLFVFASILHWMVLLGIMHC